MKLATRVVLALLGGAAGLAGLAWWIGAHDAEAAARADRLRAATGARFADRVALPLGPAVPAVWLATDLLLLPVALAPVLAVDAWGGARLLRGPVPMARDADLPAGLLLPAGGLAGLAPEARATLLAALGQLLAERPVPAARVQVVGDAAAGVDLAWLLSWLR